MTGEFITAVIKDGHTGPPLHGDRNHEGAALRGGP
jgi:hypothetical protein